MKVHEIMTAHARCVGPENTLVEAAGLMRELDVGALPVCDSDRLAGMLTDRDMVLRGTADGRDPNTTAVRDVMSSGIVFVYADQEVEEAARLMEEKQVRRLPVLNREKRLVGILALGDIATSSSPGFSGQALREVSQPAHPTGRQRRLARASEPARRKPRVPDETRRQPAARVQSGGGGKRRQTSAKKKAAQAPSRGRQRKPAGAAGKTSRRVTTRSSASRKTARAAR